MTTFNDRENAFENKYAHDADMQFKANARCNKLLGYWAAEKLGKTGDDAEAYAKSVVISDLEEAGHEDVMRKLVADMDGVADDAEIRAEMAKCRSEAKSQIFDEA